MTRILIDHFKKPKDGQVAHSECGLTVEEMRILQEHVDRVAESQKLQQLGMDQMYDIYHLKTLEASPEPFTQSKMRQGDLNVSANRYFA